MQNAEPAVVFAALGDVTRLNLVRRLSDGKSRSIASLVADTEISRQAVSKHLKVLEHAGLIAVDRVGWEARLTLRPAQIAAAQACLTDVAARWDAALLRLKAHLEGA
jgi:DNA-binding transcriptional ArsR family regulator